MSENETDTKAISADDDRGYGRYGGGMRILRVTVHGRDARATPKQMFFSP